MRSFQKFALQGLEFHASNQAQKAAEAYEKAYALHKKDTKTLVDMADVYIQLKEYKKAAQIYLEAYESDHDEYKALYKAALSQEQLQNYTKVKEYATTLIHMDRKRSKYFRLIARSLWQEGQKEQALSWYALVRDSDRDAIDKAMAKEYVAQKESITPQKLEFKYEATEDVKELFALAQEYKTDSYDIKALRSYEKILQVEAKNEKAHKNMAELLQKHKAYDKALYHYQAITEPDAQTLENIGALYHSMQKYKEALAFYEDAYALNAHDELLRAMVSSAFYLKDQEKMSRYFEQLQRKNPLLANKLIYAIEATAGMEHSSSQTLLYLALNRWYSFLQAEDKHDS